MPEIRSAEINRPLRLSFNASSRTGPSQSSSSSSSVFGGRPGLSGALLAEVPRDPNTVVAVLGQRCTLRKARIRELDPAQDGEVRFSYHEDRTGQAAVLPLERWTREFPADGLSSLPGEILEDIPGSWVGDGVSLRQWAAWSRVSAAWSMASRDSDGFICPTRVDAHTHIYAHTRQSAQEMSLFEQFESADQESLLLHAFSFLAVSDRANASLVKRLWHRSNDGDKAFWLARGQFEQRELYMLGPRYSEENSLRFLQRAVAMGIPEASVDLGRHYLFGEEDIATDFNEAFRLLHSAVQNGVTADALYFLGCCYHEAKGVERDLEEAMRLFTMVPPGCPRYNEAGAKMAWCSEEKGSAENAAIWQLEYRRRTEEMGLPMWD
jgi:hypothetical protein